MVIKMENNFLDRCKFCGRVRRKGYGTVCRHCREEFVPKHPYLNTLTYIVIPITFVLMLIYKHSFEWYIQQIVSLY